MLRDRNGAIRGQRTQVSTSPRCDEAATTMALTIALLVDAYGDLPAPPSPAPASSAVAQPEAADDPFARPEAPPPVPPARPLVVETGVGGHGALGSVPDATAGVDVVAAVGKEDWRVGVEGSADAPASTANANGLGVRGSLILAKVVPCLVWRVVHGCAVVGAGLFRGEGTVGVVSVKSAFVPEIGARAALMVPLPPPFALRVHLEAAAPLKPVTLGVGAVDVWTMPIVAASAGAAMMVRFR
jgi:hypothetical protein